MDDQLRELGQRIQQVVESQLEQAQEAMADQFDWVKSSQEKLGQENHILRQQLSEKEAELNGEV